MPLNVINECWIDFLEHLHKFGYPSIDAALLKIHGSNESISYIAHHLREAKEQVAFKVLEELVAGAPEAVVERS